MPQLRHKRPICVTIRVSIKEMDDLRRMASKLDRSVGYIVGMAMRQYLYGDTNCEFRLETKLSEN